MTNRLKKITAFAVAIILGWSLILIGVFVYEHYQENKIIRLTSLGGINLNIESGDLIFYKGTPDSKTSLSLANVSDKQLIQHIRHLKSQEALKNRSKKSSFDIESAKPVTDPSVLELLNDIVDHSNLINDSLSSGDLLRIAKDRGLIDPGASNIPEHVFDPQRIYPQRDNWFYYDYTMTTIVSIVEGKVKRVTQVGNENCKGCLRVGPIKHGDSYEKVIDKFGEPSDFSKSEDLTLWRLEFEKYNTYIALEKNQVKAVGAFVSGY